MSLKTRLIHMLGGVTEAEDIEDQNNVEALTELRTLLEIQKEADSLYGKPSDEWCDTMYKYIIDRIEKLTSC